MQEPALGKEVTLALMQTGLTGWGSALLKRTRVDTEIRQHVSQQCALPAEKTQQAFTEA